MTPADFLRLTSDLAADGRLSLSAALDEATTGYPPMGRAVDLAGVFLRGAADDLGLDPADHLDPRERGAVVTRALAYAEAHP